MRAGKRCPKIATTSDFELGPKEYQALVTDGQILDFCEDRCLGVT